MKKQTAIEILLALVIGLVFIIAFNSCSTTKGCGQENYKHKFKS